MIYTRNQKAHLLTLIDTPGHADFTYEVSRSLAAVQGVLLLVDAVTGIQAQTHSHYRRARSAGVTTVIPVINKIDLPQARPDAVLAELRDRLGIDPADALLVSAKTGAGVEAILEAIVDRIPQPLKDQQALCVRVCDSWYTEYRGVHCLVQIVSGQLAVGDWLESAATGRSYQVSELGLLQPDPRPMPVLLAGQVGYLRCGIKDPLQVRSGDTLFHPAHPVAALPGLHPNKPTVYAGIFPPSREAHGSLCSALQRLLLNDPSVTMEPAESTVLGSGWRLGFLGSLHLSVMQERLRQEYGAEVIVTAPSVAFEMRMRGTGEAKAINGPADFPSTAGLASVAEFREPVVQVSIRTRQEFLGSVLELCAVHINLGSKPLPSFFQCRNIAAEIQILPLKRRR